MTSECVIPNSGRGAGFVVHAGMHRLYSTSLMEVGDLATRHGRPFRSVNVCTIFPLTARRVEVGGCTPDKQAPS